LSVAHPYKGDVLPVSDHPHYPSSKSLSIVQLPLFLTQTAKMRLSVTIAFFVFTFLASAGDLKHHPHTITLYKTITDTVTDTKTVTETKTVQTW
jgi:hypothetical protein